MKYSDVGIVYSDCNWENGLRELSCSRCCRGPTPMCVHEVTGSSGAICFKEARGMCVCGSWGVWFIEMDNFFQACADALIVGDRDFGINEPSGVLSSQVFRSVLVIEEHSICPHRVVGVGWNQQGSWARMAAIW